MLPKQHRLPLRTDWHRVKERGRTFQSPLFGLVVAKRTLAANSSTSEECIRTPSEVSLGGSSRFGFIVSKKISKKAVERNRVRRLLSEAVRQLLAKIRPGFEVVFLAKKAILDRGFKEILEEVEMVFDKAGILVSNF